MRSNDEWSGFARISSTQVIDVCRRAIAGVASCQQRDTDEFVERYRQRINKRRRFWSMIPGISYREASTDDVKLLLDQAVENGGIGTALSIGLYYPVSCMGENWKKKAENLIKLASTSSDVYVRDDDWVGILGLAGKNYVQKEGSNSSYR
jgi:hypothetical protein